MPLQKDKRKAHHSCDNYRALTLGSIIGKLYDAIIIKQQTGVFDTSDLQFGFKDGLSTTMCTFMVKETISYYVNNGSNVHVLLLDASKAFDRVNYCMLFQKLIDKGMCPLVVRLLLHMYTNQKLQVSWNDIMSNQFIVGNVSAELQGLQMALYYYVLLVLSCKKLLRCVKNIVLFSGQKANYSCIIRSMLICILK